MNIVPTIVDREIRHALVVSDQLSGPARALHIEETRGRAYRLVENICIVAGELRDLLDQLDGTAPRVDMGSLIGRLRMAEAELDAATVTLAGQMDLVAA